MSEVLTLPVPDGRKNTRLGIREVVVDANTTLAWSVLGSSILDFVELLMCQSRFSISYF